MHYLNIGLDDRVSVFDICQAHAQLESDYNVGGMLRERPSNARRNESTSCQLSRMKYNGAHRWVQIVPPPDDCTVLSVLDPSDEDVRDIYLRNVLRYGLPIDADMMAFIKARYVPEFLAQYPQCAGDDYLQGRKTA